VQPKYRLATLLVIMVVAVHSIEGHPTVWYGFGCGITGDYGPLCRRAGKPHNNDLGTLNDFELTKKENYRKESSDPSSCGPNGYYPASLCKVGKRSLRNLFQLNWLYHHVLIGRVQKRKSVPGIQKCSLISCRLEFLNYTELFLQGNHKIWKCKLLLSKTWSNFCI